MFIFQDRECRKYRHNYRIVAKSDDRRVPRNEEPFFLHHRCKRPLLASGFPGRRVLDATNAPASVKRQSVYGVDENICFHNESAFTECVCICFRTIRMQQLHFQTL